MIERRKRPTSEERKENRKSRRERFAKLLGVFTGQAFGTAKVGWVAVVIAVIVGIIQVWKAAQ